ncbi:glycosyl hydrolase family 79 C-terminal domain-containing protein [Paractinoplanes maris]|uniref:glycosyl hydrolase family 79 C-terminal domain-containing protein n=1 Tax=Paractinoplanes maris TaxID=1734446 RepID=UPI0020228B20|nr:glycosyl hydrolase family 79 C-terminal domain-containing protein [Actinoplanes maris]
MRTRTLRTGCAAALGLAMLATIGLSATPGAATAAAGASVTVDLAHPGGRLPADLVGLSFEMRELGIGNLDARKGNLAQLFKTLGRSNVRISGNTLDRDGIWLREGEALPSPQPDWLQHVVTRSDIERLDEFLGETGWKTEVGINLGRWDAADATDQARVMTKVLGPKLVAAECGNEPDQWVGKGFRPAGFAYADYRRDFQACAAAVGPSIPLAGPDAASPSSAWAASLARDESRLGLVMLHQYAMDPTGTMARLLSPETYASQLRSITPNLDTAKELGKPLRLDETNSAWGGGIDGVSNKHGSALWALDYSLQLGQAGVAGLNFHGGLGVCDQPIWNGKWQLYTPICAAGKAGELAQIYRVMPIYYGLWMARQLGSGRFLPVTLSTDRNLTAYAVRGDDGKLRLAVISKEDPATGPVDVSITVGGANRTAGVLTMTGSSLTGVDTAVQGATVGSDGRLRPGRPTRAPVRNGALSLQLTAGSAAVITLDR